MCVFEIGIEDPLMIAVDRLQHSHLSENHRAVVLCRPRASGRELLTAWPLWQRGLAELMFFRSTPGRMGNLLIAITAPRNQIGAKVRDLGVTLYRRRIHVRLQLTCGRDPSS